MKWTAMALLISLVVQQGIPAGSAKPEDLGAFRAHVSDKAAVELLVDLLRGVASGERPEGIVRKHAAPESSFGAVSGTHNSTSLIAVEIHSDGIHASAVTDGGTLHFLKENGTWKLSGAEGAIGTTLTATARGGSEGPSAGATFLQTPVSREHGIETLSRGTTRSMIGRSLMSTSGPTASFYNVRYTTSAPFVHATYIQFLVDREWNRLLYGNLNNWVKSYDDVSGPVAIETDPGGHVFLSESGSQQVSVLNIAGEGAEAHLVPLFSLQGLTEPGDLAFNDNGTPFDRSDDHLYVIDAAVGQIVRFSINGTGGSQAAVFEGFESPTVVCAGRWNGTNNNLLYVVDRAGKRLGLYEDHGSSLELITEISGSGREYFQDVAMDHFGNLYLVESMNGTIRKYTSDLTYLDSEGGSDIYAAPGFAHIPFGKIEIEGEGTYWSGFDQMFAVERWGETTGVQRRTLGLALRDIRFLPDADIRAVHSTFVMTDFGNIGVKIYDEAGNLVRTVQSSWMTSGRKSVPWDRRADDGSQVPAGLYRMEIEGASAYRDEAVRSETQFYLPLYFWQDAGSTIALDDAMLVQGSAVAWGSTPSQTANEHAASVQYRFTGLNPESEYMVAAEYLSGDGVTRMQDLSAGGVPLHSVVPVGETPHYTGYLIIPGEAFASGELLLSVDKRGEGSAVVSQLWLKETGAGFNPQQLDGNLPRAYALEQNYPNPFNPSTVIRYSLPVDGRITLKVFDITGREVATLVNEQKQAGTYEVNFDAKNVNGRSLASGVYFYRVQAGQFTEARKMVLLK